MARLTPLVYLAVRGELVWRTTRSGFAPLWIHIAVLVALPVALKGFEFWLMLRSVRG